MYRLIDTMQLDCTVFVDRDVNDILLPDNKTCADCFDGGMLDTLRILSTAGLTDVFCVLNSPANLSDGQKHRFKIAKALASDKKYIFIDDFCSSLDRITAGVISQKIRTFIAKSNKVLIIATSHDDLFPDLQPDVIVLKKLASETEVIYRTPQANNKKELVSAE
jgi:ABC-type ATPase with predicted acetyltransferase domain